MMIRITEVRLRKNSGNERKSSESENGAIVMLLRTITMGPFTSDCGAWHHNRG